MTENIYLHTNAVCINFEGEQIIQNSEHIFVCLCKHMVSSFIAYIYQCQLETNVYCVLFLFIDIMWKI